MSIQDSMQHRVAEQHKQITKAHRAQIQNIISEEKNAVLASL